MRISLGPIKIKSGKSAEEKRRKETKSAERNKYAERRKLLKQLGGNSSDKKKKLNRELARQPAPKFVQDTIKYNQMCEDGICEVTNNLYSKTICFADINYKMARRDEQIDVFSRYCELLNALDPSVYLQISILNRRIDKDAFEQEMFIPSFKENQEYEKYRQEFNDILKKRAMEGQNSIIHEKYMTFSTFADGYENAVQALAQHEGTILDHLKDMGCAAQTLSGQERLRIIHDMLNPDSTFNFNYKDLVYNNLRTKDYVSPSSFDFGETVGYRFGRKYGQTLFLKDMPAKMVDELISTVTELPIDLAINVHIDPIDRHEAFEFVKKQIGFMDQQFIDEQQKALKRGYSTAMLPYELTRSRDEAIKLRDDMQNNKQNMLRVTVLINTYADTEKELTTNIFQIMSAAKSKDCGCATLDFMEEKGMNSSLPLGCNHLEIQRTLTTASTAIFIPFSTQELYQKGGLFYGQNALSKNMIFFNRRTLDAPNGLIVGMPGSGKSMAAKYEMLQVLMSSPRDEVIVIDPEREFTPLANGYNGEVVHISAGSKNHLNPMDISIDYADDQEPLSLKSEFVLTFCELLIGGSNGLSAEERSLLDNACRICYGDYFMKPGKNPVPTFKDFHKVLDEMPNEIAKRLSVALDIYANGSLSAFSHQTNVNTNKRFVVYDIKDLGKQLRTFGMLVVLDQIWNRITSNREKGIRTWFYTDEFQLLTSNKYCAQYYFELWSRSRKWGAIPTAITQNIETLLLSDMSRRMLSNSDFIMMFKQSRSDADELAKLLDISSKQLSHVTRSNSGQGLLFAGKGIIPFVNIVPKESALYEMMTTKIEDLMEQKRGDE